MADMARQTKVGVLFDQWVHPAPKTKHQIKLRKLFGKQLAIYEFCGKILLFVCVIEFGSASSGQLRNSTFKIWL